MVAIKAAKGTPWQEIARQHTESLLPSESIRPGLDSHRLAVNDALERRDRTLGQAGKEAESILSKAGPSFIQLLDSVLDASEHSKLFQQLGDLNAIDATSALEDLRSGRVTSVELVRTLAKRSAYAHQSLACLTEQFYENALRDAAEKDALREAAKKGGSLNSLGKLWGLPISIKAHISIKGRLNQRCFAFDLLDESSASSFDSDLVETQGPAIASQDAALVRILREEGAILFVKTTMPQSIMHLDTRSPSYGQTLNPWNLSLSPGGSSGGESAVIAAGGSLIGLGTDIGGSVRQPCAVTGLYGLRPTTLRLATAGFRVTMPGNDGVGSACGPMCRSLRDVQLFMRTVLGASGQNGQEAIERAHELDVSMIRMPWRDLPSLVDGVLDGESGRRKPIKVALLSTDGFVHPIAPIRRAVQLYKQKLNDYAAQNPGKIELVEVELPAGTAALAWTLIRELYFMDGGALIKQLADSTGEPLLPLTEYILQQPVKNHTAGEVWKMTAKREGWKKKFWSETWRGTWGNPDVLLCPAGAIGAPRPGKLFYWGYTSFWNLTDYPGLTFPAGILADATADLAFDQQHPLPAVVEGDRGVLDAQNRSEYETHRDVFDGAPIGLQLIAPRFFDEELLQAAELIQSIVQG